MPCAKSPRQNSIASLLFPSPYLTTDGRLWKYLLAHRDAAGVVTLSGGMNALAKRLDMGRSSLYRSLDALSDAGRIRREGKNIIILKMEE